MTENDDAVIWEVPVTQHREAWRIAVISMAVLILELAFIRHVPAEVRSISYFTNLIVASAFFGLGLGCILQRVRSLDWLLPLGLVLVWAFVVLGRGVVVYTETEEVHYWFLYGHVGSQARRLPLVQAAFAMFLFGALPFVALGQALARAMDAHSRLVAYGWDIAGSLAGTVVFTLSSFLGVPPWCWPPVVMLVWATVILRSPVRRVVYVGCGALFVAFAYSPFESQWSPYYYVQSGRKPDGLVIWVNSSFHQYALDFTSNVPEHGKIHGEMLHKWGRPYELYRRIHKGRAPRKVLILGAGTGNDVFVALRNGAEEVVAVEIDPVILQLGRTHNPTRPYDDPRVRAVVDDARHFLRTTEERFDLIIFGTLDSQSLLSGHTNLRLENYVYTREALSDARERLANGGVVGLFYAVLRPWLYSRIYSTMREAFGEHVVMILEDSKFLFNTTILATRGVANFRDSAESVAKYGGGTVSTDDWPFIYLERRIVSPVYQSLLAAVSLLIVGAFVLLRRIHPVTGLHVNFWLLGVGFTLMESSALVRLALVFGNTWIVNAVVFGSVLLTIFVANRLVQLDVAPRLAIAWPTLCLFILVNYFVDLRSLFEVGLVMRVLGAGALIGVPVFFAAVCFSRLFSNEAVTGYPLGVNLIGAMSGGLIEYVSMIVGMRAVLLVVLAIYAGAWLSSILIERRGSSAAAAS